MSSLRDHIERTLPELDGSIAAEADGLTNTEAIALPQR
ncbi:hypothetical protein HNR13_004024 [Leifsonia shinshuensis]|uniref:Uncharacterized protein n=1 Tax=Leifsonia shinshuensis TaxID=150026 RepID=A0A853CYS1_9MICO|nr:hypothetical protein [Leifsonia shinshuensis]